MSAHTPGPWAWNGEDQLWGAPNLSENILSAGDDGKPYGMHSARIEHHWDIGIADGNRSLIAAAPDLLAACKDALETYRGFLFNAYGKYDDDTTRDLIAAIAKAEGRE